MLDDILAVLRQRYGAAWGRDSADNLRFSIDAEQLLGDVEGVHLIGEPQVGEDELTFTMWTDIPLFDVMSADRLAFAIFARVAGEILFVERQVEAKSVRYRFITGSPRSGHVGSVVLAGPHAAAFADRQLTHGSSPIRFHA